jgi:hypothetical protein
MVDNTCVVVTLRTGEREQLVLDTAEGTVVIEVRPLTASKCKVAVHGPRAVRVSRRDHRDWSKGDA